MSGETKVVTPPQPQEVKPTVPAVNVPQSDSKKPRMSGTIGMVQPLPGVDPSGNNKPKLRRNVFSFDESWFSNFRQGFHSSMAGAESVETLEDIDTCSIVSLDSNATDLSQASAPPFIPCDAGSVMGDVRPNFDPRRRFSHGIVLNWLRGVNNPAIPEENMRNANSTVITPSSDEIKGGSLTLDSQNLSQFGPNPKKGSMSTRELNAFTPSGW